MQKQEMEIAIGPDGKVSLKVFGVKGDDCLDLTKDLEEALGEVTERERTAEFYERSPAPNQNKVTPK